MSNYVLESKNDHITFQKWPVNVVETMLFKDQTSQHRVMIIKLKNTSPTPVIKCEVEMSAYNFENELIQKATYPFEDLMLKPQAYTVIKEKIKLHESITKVEFKLLSADTLTNSWSKSGWLKEEKTVLNKKIDEPITTHHYKPLKFPMLIMIGTIAFYIFVIFMIHLINQVILLMT
ncbi:MAG: hypothetical protein ACOCUE_03190 [Candidatus Izemoplasmataceae bacterium]